MRDKSVKDRIRENVAKTTAAASVAVWPTLSQRASKIVLDPKVKRVAVVYPGGNVGSGHSVPARILQKYYLNRGYEVDLFNIDKYQNWLTRKVVSENYADWVSQNPAKHMPTGTSLDFTPVGTKATPIYEKIKRVKKGKAVKEPFLKSVGKEAWNLFAGHKAIIKDLKKRPYSRVFALHGNTADVLFRTGLPADVITTDLIHDPFSWQTRAAGKYFVPTRAAAKRFTDIGVDPKKIKVTGSLIVDKEFKKPHKIPIPKTIKKIRAQQAGKGKIITVTGGGTGIQVDLITKQLSRYYSRKDPSTKIIAITASNQKAYQNLTNAKVSGSLQNVIIKEKVPKLGRYFKHSDIVVTRPGGSTSAELLHTGTPTVTVAQAPLPKSLRAIGSHEQGNIKILYDEGMSRHFQTKHKIISWLGKKEYSPEVTNISDLDKVMDDVEKNYKKMKSAAETTSAKMVKVSPEDIIYKEGPGMQRKPKLRYFSKAITAAGLVGAAYYGAKLFKDFKERKKQVRPEPLLKIGRDLKTSEKAIIGIGATALVAGTVAGALFPGMRGKAGVIGGSFVATKRLFVDVPREIFSKKRNALKILDFPDKTTQIKLTPTETVQRSKEILAARGHDLSKMTKPEIRAKSKKYDAISTAQMLKEQETAARKAGSKKLWGISHFTPEQAARFGFRESPAISPAGNTLIWGKHSPFSYYTSQAAISAKKLKSKGLSSLDEMDAYWLTAPRESVRMFEKDLTIPHEKAIELAKIHLTRIKGSKRYKQLHKSEKGFKVKYDKFLQDIAKAKDTT